MPHPTNKGDRAHQLKKAKAATVRRIKQVRTAFGAGMPNGQWNQANLTPRNIGRQTSQHGTCGCWMCKSKTYEDKHDPHLYKGSASDTGFY